MANNCTWFPEYWMGKYIGDCCWLHDETCSTKVFFRCLRTKLNLFWSTLISLGGALGCMVKYKKV